MSASLTHGGRSGRSSRPRAVDGSARYSFDPFDIAGQVHDVVAPLVEQIHALRASISLQSQVLTPAQVAAFAFDGKITAGRVCEYVRGKSLPEGVDLPLPARRIGNTYHIPVAGLNRWRIGEATIEDLFPWQRDRATRTDRSA